MVSTKLPGGGRCAADKVGPCADFCPEMTVFRKIAQIQIFCAARDEPAFTYLGKEIQADGSRRLLYGLRAAKTLNGHLLAI